MIINLNQMENQSHKEQQNTTREFVSKNFEISDILLNKLSPAERQLMWNDIYVMKPLMAGKKKSGDANFSGHILADNLEQFEEKLAKNYQKWSTLIEKENLTNKEVWSNSEYPIGPISVSLTKKLLLEFIKDILGKEWK